MEFWRLQLIKMDNCIFCEIVKGRIPCEKILESDEFFAFLSIFPNTEGVTVVIPKKHYSSYIFDLPDEVIYQLMIFSKKVVRMIDLNLKDVGRTAVVFEGFGVDHHAWNSQYERVEMFRIRVKS